MSRRRKEGVKERIDGSVAAFLKRHGLFGKSLALAFSGGQDSLSLLISLARLSQDVVALYVNHHLRGETELSWEVSLNMANARRLGVWMVVLDADKSRIKALSRAAGLEAAARQVRYSLLEDYCVEHDLTAILAAHTRDDMDESDIIGFFRGRQVLGSSIPERSGMVYRPMLAITHAENAENVRSSGLFFSQDSTNLKPDGLRTSIRLLLKPALDGVFPSFSASLERRRAESTEAAAQDRNAIFSAFSLLGHRNSNNNRISGKSIDSLLRLAQDSGKSGRIDAGDIIALHRKDGLALIRKCDAPWAEGAPPVKIVREGLTFLPDGGRVLVSSAFAGSFRSSLPYISFQSVLVSKVPFVVKPAREEDEIVFKGRARSVRDIMRKRQISPLLLRCVRIMIRDGSVLAIVFDGLDEKSCVADGQEISRFEDAEPMFLVTFA